MAEVITIVNMKGGVGKSTTAFNLSHALAAREKRVLAVDLDHQATLTYLFGQDERALEKAEKTLYYSIVKEKPLSSIILHSTPSLIPSSIVLSTVDIDLMLSQNYTVNILRDRLQEVQNDFDFILLDCPPSLNILVSSALAIAQHVIIPVKTDVLSILGILLLLDRIEGIRMRSNHKLSILGILPTMYNGNLNNDKEALQSLKWISEEKKIPLLDPIPRSTKYDKAATETIPVVLKSGDIPGVDVFHKLAEQIINHA
jgi:chromosome partitioning protein